MVDRNLPMPGTPHRLQVTVESWPIAGLFAISRGTKTEARVVVAQITRSGLSGRGECVPYGRYGETVESVVAAIDSLSQPIRDGIDRDQLQRLLPAGAARNALDCALWDLEAKTGQARAWELANIDEPAPVLTAYTISLGTPEAMAEAARQTAHRPLLKVKLGADGDPDRIAAVRAAAKDAKLIVDANEGWTLDNLDENVRACLTARVALIEQPLPSGQDSALKDLKGHIPVCADESVHDRRDIPRLAELYDAVNVKLDKAGGLTEALATAREARNHGLQIVVGCMVGTSLAMAPAFLLTPLARYVDLDGPLLLQRDRAEGLVYDGSLVHPPSRRLWG